MCKCTFCVIKFKTQQSQSTMAPATAVDVAQPLDLVPLASALAVLRSTGDTSAQVIALPHVVTATSDCLDYARPQF